MGSVLRSYEVFVIGYFCVNVQSFIFMCVQQLTFSALTAAVGGILRRKEDGVSSIELQTEPYYPGPRFTAAVKQDAPRVIRLHFNWQSVPVRLPSPLIQPMSFLSPSSTLSVHIWVSVFEISLFFGRVRGRLGNLTLLVQISSSTGVSGRKAV